jgi:hypothetical protein
LKEITDVSEVFGEFMEWMKSENFKLHILEQTSLPENQCDIEKLISQHQTFLESFSFSSNISNAISQQSWRNPESCVQK